MVVDAIKSAVAMDSGRQSLFLNAARSRRSNVLRSVVAGKVNVGGRRHGRWRRSTFCFLAALLFLVSAEADEFYRGPEISNVRILPYREVDMASAVTGRVREVLVTPGDRVETGAVLCRLEDDQHRLAVEAAKLELDRLTATAAGSQALALAEEQLKAAESELIQLKAEQDRVRRLAESDVEQLLAESVRKAAEADRRRAESSRAQFEGSVSGAEMRRLVLAEEQAILEERRVAEARELLKLQFKKAAADVVRQESRIRSAELAVSQERVNRNLYETEIREQELNVRRAEIQLDRCLLKAPFSGVIAQVNAEAGAWTDPGITLVRLIQLHPVKLHVPVPIKAVDRLRVGEEVLFRISGGPSKRVAARIQFISPERDAVNQRVMLGAEISNADESLVPGMVGTLTLP